MHTADLLRYGLWCGVAATAAGNRRAYRLTTAWLPHLLANTVSLLLPDLLRLGRLRRRQAARPSLRLARDTLVAMVLDNPGYVRYVAPLAAGYLLSGPWLNIYKGEWAELRLAGLGPDSLPHAATAFALTALVCDTLGAARQAEPAPGALGDLVEWGQRHPALLSALVLALATALWEASEYRIYQSELAQRDDPQQINMQWSRSDMLRDCIANAIGWALALRLTSAPSPLHFQVVSLGH
jgi:hypothetical protein